MTKIGVLLGGEENSTRRQMQEIINFETMLAEITVPAENRRDEEKLYHLMSISQVQELAPFLDWREYFDDAMRHRSKKIKPDYEMVVVYAPGYLKDLSSLIMNLNNTNENNIMLNNYLVWQTVRSLTGYLSKAFRDAYKGLRKALVGSEGGEESWRYCVSDTNNVIGFAIGAMFVREVFHGNSKPMAEDMINEIREAFKRNLKKLSWMDQETREAAERKADAITDMIGHEDPTSFVHDCATLLEAAYTPIQGWIPKVHHQLKSEAARWWDQFGEFIGTWEQFQTRLTSVFVNPVNLATLHTELYGKAHIPNESMNKFIRWKVQLYQKLLPASSPSDLIAHRANQTGDPIVPASPSPTSIE
uniref:Peptidase M13 N-terminal domain-containing protein n=1 Tax=Timema monikensis TaxID=170555 RepID=A0A7R9HS49_9NEOP|nr:unnamed protein product [Timema monikensis]